MTDLRSAVSAQIPAALADLANLVAIPSISAERAHDADVLATARAVASLATDLGFPDVRVVEAGGAPAVIARFPAPAGAPTVCLYAHHDVQPAGDETLWTSPPFAVERRGGRLYARGVVDDKAGVAVHLAALRALGTPPPVGVTLFVEGEEEIGSPSLAALLARHRDLLASDVFVICDSGNWAVGRPAFTTTLRGLVDVVVEVATLEHALHSGVFGGVVPDALTALCRMLGSLHDDRGDVAVQGLATGATDALDYPEDRLRAESGLLDGVALTGSGSVVERLWARPSVTVVALDATRVAHASNTLAPSARAKVSMRIAPNQDPAAALAALKEHLRAHAPWGARVSFGEETAAAGSVVAFEGPHAEAAFGALAESWGTDPVFMGQGGSIPMVADFQRAFPDATILVTGVADPDSRMHGIDESLDLADFERAALAEALLLRRLADA